MSITQWIEVDSEVMAAIKGQAEPFVDTPNDALRQLLGLGRARAGRCAPLPSAEPPRSAARAQIGELLPMAEYDLPLLRVLSRAGGSASVAEVRDAVEVALSDRFTALDRTPLRSGQVRWENRLGFARLKFVERGLLRADSPRGMWELTEAGIEELGRLEAEAQQRDKEGSG